MNQVQWKASYRALRTAMRSIDARAADDYAESGTAAWVKAEQFALADAVDRRVIPYPGLLVDAHPTDVYDRYGYGPLWCQLVTAERWIYYWDRIG